MVIEHLFLEKTGLDFNTFYKKYRPKLIWYLMKMSNDMIEAEEVADEGITKAIDEIEKYEQDKSQFSTWLFTITKRLMIQRIKIKRKFESIETEQQEGMALGDFLVADNRNTTLLDDRLSQQIEIIKRRIPELPKKYAIVLQMREIDGLSYQEITDILGINLNTTKSQIKQGRAALRRKIKDDFDKLERSTFWDVDQDQ
jgi:RNA polymerase sigma-70 factor, ECF subfamily